MNRPRRNIDRIDYRKFHLTVQKEPNNMSDSENKLISEAKIAEDIKEFFVVSELSNLFSDEEIYESLDSVSRYSKLYRDIHTELKLNLKEEHHKKYPEYDEIIDKIRNYIKDARRKIRFLKNEAEQKRQSEQKSLKSEQKGEKKVSLASQNQLVSFFCFFLEKYVSFLS